MTCYSYYIIQYYTLCKWY